MKPIFSRTLEVTLKKTSIILVVLAGVACGYLVAANFNRDTERAFEIFLEQILMAQHALVFMGLDGIVLAILTVSTGTGLISTEVHEGTFKLLSAKPNSRAQILLSKLLGAVLGLSILMVLQLLCYFGYLAILGNLDGNILAELVSYLPGYMAYGFIFILIGLSISTFVGTIAKKKVAALLPLLALVILIFGGYPFYRMVGNFGTRIGEIPSVLDLNYQLALIFKSCISYKGNIAGREIIAIITNLYKVVYLDKDIVRATYGNMALLPNNSLASPIVCGCYAVFAAVMYISSFAILKKKDI